MNKHLLIALTALSALSGVLRGTGVIGDPRQLYFAGLDSTAGVAFSSNYGYYVTDDSNDVINHYDANGNLVASITASSTTNGNAVFGSPAGLEVDGQGNIWVADPDNNQVLEMDANGVQLKVLGITNDAGALNYPNDVALGPQNTLYVADAGNNRIAAFDITSGAFLFSFGSFGFGQDPLLMAAPMGLSVSGNRVYVADTGNARVTVFDLAGNYQMTVGGRGVGAGGFDSPFDVAVDGQGRIWVADNGAADVQIFTAGGTFVSGIGAGFDGVDFQDLTHLYAEPDGDVLAADGYANRFFIWDSSVAGMRTSPKPSTQLASAPLTVGPVPARAGQALQLILPAAADKVTWQLFTADMRLAGETQSFGQSRISFTQTADLAAGVYLAKVVMEQNGTQREALQKIVIIR